VVAILEALRGKDKEEMIEVVLVQPEIPQNTGSIARMCAATGVKLHLVGPLGFSLDDRYLKRAGLDYWPDVCLGVHRDFESLLNVLGDRPLYLLTKKASTVYTALDCTEDDIYVFGSESVGLPDEMLERFQEQTLRIPIRPGVRSLNMASAVHIITYHALASLEFPGIPSPQIAG